MPSRHGSANRFAVLRSVLNRWGPGISPRPALPIVYCAGNENTEVSNQWSSDWDPVIGFLLTFGAERLLPHTHVFAARVGDRLGPLWNVVIPLNSQPPMMLARMPFDSHFRPGPNGVW